MVSLFRGTTVDASMEEKMWENLKSTIILKNKLLPVIDVSGSMGNLSDSSTSSIHHAVGIGLMLSESLPGILNNTFLTFSSAPELVKLNKDLSLKEKLCNIRGAHWGMKTDLIKAFHLIVDQIDQGNLLLEEVPDSIVVFTDMEFNSGFCKSDSMGRVREIFTSKGIKMPNIIFWNLSSTVGLPENTQEDVVYLSGFSVAYMREIFDSGNISLHSIIRKTLYKDRYNLY